MINDKKNALCVNVKLITPTAPVISAQIKRYRGVSEVSKSILRIDCDRKKNQLNASVIIFIHVVYLRTYNLTHYTVSES